ncbi:hypothetical protein AVEN_202858-1 [Araneus ventricosus]|uniref:Uncharacterized protein n=1 Tax=Araneus ventricosus TaxID=182803 RepID=A0A4Y2R6X6_ARAVE|nr:hypothetical protein AVEN_202858-1 [Araneus ventricosus]
MSCGLVSKNSVCSRTMGAPGSEGNLTKRSNLHDSVCSRTMGAPGLEGNLTKLWNPHDSVCSRAMEHSCIVPTMQANGGSIMIWNCCNCSGISNIMRQ